MTSENLTQSSDASLRPWNRRREAVTQPVSYFNLTLTEETEWKKLLEN